eukprot:TRINITY_DN11411_c0_g8_i1.p1 TRINITY_DN11411_c0_g8~~TRINITY_DN11411_c0_g8_i1.p1  ORF type:complete len:697 (-),score=100.98 TRINITY_DN11411_c0_g8_i1:148-2178(-)
MLMFMAPCRGIAKAQSDDRGACGSAPALASAADAACAAAVGAPCSLVGAVRRRPKARFVAWRIPAVRRALAIVLVLAGALPTPRASGEMEPLARVDFGYPGELTVQDNVDIVVGYFSIELRIPIGSIGDFASCIRSTVAGVGSVYAPVRLQMWQTLSTFSLTPVKLNVNYYLLPYWPASETAAKLAALRQGITFAQLLRWQVHQNSRLPGNIVIGRIVFSQPRIIRKVVIRPLVPPGPSEEEVKAGGGKGGETWIAQVKTQAQKWAQAQATSEGELADTVAAMESLCRNATTACDCSALSTCTWVPYEKGYWCVSEDLATSDDGDGVTCSKCPTQEKCPNNPDRMCASQWDPCACSSSRAECYWNTSSSSCFARNSNESTSCYVCSRQDQCGPPKVVAFDPPSRDARVERNGNVSDRFVRIIFDRPVYYAGASGGVLLVCEGDTDPRVPPQKSLKIDDAMLQVELAMVPVQGGNVTCGLSLAEGLVKDGEGVLFLGMRASEYLITMGDTADPRVELTKPKNNARNIDPAITVLINFTEPVKLTEQFSAKVYSLEDASDGQVLGGVAASLNASDSRMSIVDDFQLAIDMDGLLEPYRSYSLQLAPGCVVDSSGNRFGGLDAGLYAFDTGASQKFTGAGSSGPRRPTVILYNSAPRRFSSSLLAIFKFLSLGLLATLA